MLFLYVSNIFIKNAFISKTRDNSAKIRPFSESAHLIYLKIVEISSAKICVLTSVIGLLVFTLFLNNGYCGSLWTSMILIWSGFSTCKPSLRNFFNMDSVVALFSHGLF